MPKYTPLSEGWHYNMYSGNDCVAWIRARMSQLGGSYINGNGNTMRPVDGTTPQAGAIAVWGYYTSVVDGHVAFVENVINGVPLFSHGAWGSSPYGAVNVTTSSGMSIPLKGYWYTDLYVDGEPEPGPDPDPPVATQPITPEYGPGGTIWLTNVVFSCHYVDSTYTNPDTGKHDVYFHPAMKMYLNGSVVATSKKGMVWGYNLPGSGDYTDISWTSSSSDGTKTNDWQIRLDGDHPDADRFDILHMYCVIEYYKYTAISYDSSELAENESIKEKSKFTSYFDGTKWTTFKKE